MTLSGAKGREGEIKFGGERDKGHIAKGFGGLVGLWYCILNEESCKDFKAGK